MVCVRRPLPEEFNFDDPALVAAYDELPLWSAPFGLALLEAVRMRPGVRALDVGCGTGFPLLELAQRLGRTGHVWGIDPWKAGLDRARAKMGAYGVENVTLVEGVAERIPIEDGSIDLVVSNNGLNNVADLERAIHECARVSRKGAQLVCTWNLPETMTELYDVFEAVLRETGREAEVAKMRAHIVEKRKPVEHVVERLERVGYRIDRVRLREFAYRFADGSAMFEHWFFRIGFIPPWVQVIAQDAREEVFSRIVARLDAAAASTGGLSMRIPFACVDATSP